jgi:hypothetical protein
MNKTLPLEAKLDPEAISVPAPTLAPGPPPEILQIRRPSPKDRTLRVQASVDEIGLVAFDALQHADELAQSISPDDTCFSFSARYSVEAQSIDSFSGGAIDKEYFGDNDNIISEQPGNLFALNLRVITGDDPPDLRSLPVDAPLEKISTKALVKRPRRSRSLLSLRLLPLLHPAPPASKLRTAPEIFKNIIFAELDGVITRATTFVTFPSAKLH